MLTYGRFGAKIYKLLLPKQQDLFWHRYHLHS